MSYALSYHLKNVYIDPRLALPGPLMGGGSWPVGSDWGSSDGKRLGLATL